MNKLLLLRALVTCHPSILVDNLSTLKLETEDWDAFLIEVIQSDGFSPPLHGLKLFPLLTTVGQLESFCRRYDTEQVLHRVAAQELIEIYPDHMLLMRYLSRHTREVSGLLLL